MSVKVRFLVDIINGRKKIVDLYVLLLSVIYEVVFFALIVPLLQRLRAGPVRNRCYLGCRLIATGTPALFPI